MPEEVIQTIGEIGDWYMNEDSTYIRITRATKAPHLLPKKECS
jgi:hypothetical protein